VRIEVATDDPTAELVLNAIELDIDACFVDGAAAGFRLDAATERLFVTPGQTVDVGEHVVEIEFRGTLNDQLRGFYRSTYRDVGGAERVIATTQMQSTDCRRAFPCWDEPDFKAVFSVTLVVDPGLIAVSNGPEVEREALDDGRVAVRFADTMVMSSYLVAFVVGPLEATDWVDVDGIPVRIVHVPGKGDLTGFGLDVAAFCLRWFQDYYGIAYPSDKVDLVALPDFAAGAMENLGCITFRENLLLVDPATGTQQERQLVADVVAHELAHMWFGDLVTMGWWNGIWLNEAFATFMEIAACDAYRPEWERWTSFGLERSMAFETDSLSATRPVEYEVHSPADCEGMFDVLTYQKGGALLRMLEQYLGEERFRLGVGHYLRTHAYGNTETSDLWDAIEETSGEPVRRIMDSWIWQPGYPLVSAQIDGDELVLSQRRFSFDPESSDPTLWAIPLSIRVGDVSSTCSSTVTVRLPLDDGPGRGERRRPRVLPGVVLRRAPRPPDRRRRRRTDDARAVQPGRRRLERRRGGDDGGRRVHRPRRAVRRRARPRGVAVDRDRAARRAPSARRRPRAVEAFEARVAALVGPALESLGDRTPANPT
jgi:puromycin-sensitive aminopeptidase